MDCESPCEVPSVDGRICDTDDRAMIVLSAILSGNMCVWKSMIIAFISFLKKPENSIAQSDKI